MSTLVHITPQLPPAIDGVGDYCWNLWKHSPAGGTDWQFAVVHGAEDTRATWPEAKIRNFSLNASSLAAALEQSSCETVVLHYVGYAYQPKGIPIWLPKALRDWRGTNGANRRLIVMFHEMYARSSPLRSPFWVAPFARRIIRELVELADAWVTSCDRYFQQLTTDFGAPKTMGRIIPIPSNIPAPAGIGELDCGTNRLNVVVFGLARTRLWALERHWQLLRALQQNGQIEQITLVGKRPNAEEEQAWAEFSQKIGEGITWRKRFDLATSEISSELSEHEMGLLANEPDILTKSGVFAALATHGVVPVVSTPANEPLPERFKNAVLANDDSASIPHLSELLQDKAALHSRRTELLSYASRELAWPGIAQSWARVLAQANGSRATSVSAVSANVRAIATDSMEVRA
jgi:hypothetical protein